ncbi:MAG TPA: universal stress protein [Miltoncostaeaceae bacterium]|nr:universal stress protein [Miltoncostaeaceae bacterium]
MVPRAVSCRPADGGAAGGARRPRTPPAAATARARTASDRLPAFRRLPRIRPPCRLAGPLSWAGPPYVPRKGEVNSPKGGRHPRVQTAWAQPGPGIARTPGRGGPRPPGIPGRPGGSPPRAYQRSYATPPGHGPPAAVPGGGAGGRHRAGRRGRRGRGPWRHRRRDARAADSAGAETIVVGSRGLGTAGILLGSVSTTPARSAGRDVLIVR